MMNVFDIKCYYDPIIVSGYEGGNIASVYVSNGNKSMLLDSLYDDDYANLMKRVNEVVDNKNELLENSLLHRIKSVVKLYMRDYQ